MSAAGDKIREIRAPSCAARARASWSFTSRRVRRKALRRKLGMSHSRFARSFGFGLAAVQSWEQGRRRPEGPARVLLKVIEHEPEAVRRALAA